MNLIILIAIPTVIMMIIATYALVSERKAKKTDSSTAAA